MRTVLYLTLAGSFLALAACASNGPAPEHPEYSLTPEARKVVEEQGEAVAAERGYSENSQLVCETRQKLGSHMVERFCYTRAEAEDAREDARETVRSIHRRGTRAEPPR